MRREKALTMMVAIIAIVLIAGIAFSAALTADRSTPRRDGNSINIGVAIANKVYAGSMVAIDSTGYAVPASSSTALAIIGRAEEQVDNSSGTAGAKNITIGTGIYRLANQSGVGNIASADDIGKTAYAVDDQTVSLSNDSGTRSVAGRIYDVDSYGVWIDFRLSYKLGNVSLEHLDSGIKPSHISAICNTTTSETDADSQVIETHSNISATDIVTASMANSAAGVFINATTPASGSITFRLSGNGGANTQINYCAHKLAQ